MQETPRRKTRSTKGILLEGLVNHRVKRVLKMPLHDDHGENHVLGDNPLSDVELRAEIDRLRRLNRDQNEQLSQLQERILQGNNISGTQSIQNLVDGLKEIHVDIKIPKFTNNKNPNQFIERLEKYFSVKHVSEANPLNILDGALEGRARAWFEARRDSFLSYENFKTKFLEEFYSVPIRVREIMSTINYYDFDQILQTLSHLDMTFNEKINTQRPDSRIFENNLNEKQFNDRDNHANNRHMQSKSSNRESADNRNKGGYTNLCPALRLLSNVTTIEITPTLRAEKRGVLAYRFPTLVDPRLIFLYIRIVFLGTTVHVI